MKIYSLLAFVLLASNLISQTYWTRSETPLSVMRNSDAMYLPKAYTSFSLDKSEAEKVLSEAKRSSIVGGEYVEFTLPMPDGKLVTYNTVYAPVMEDNLAAKYNRIRTYKGISKDGKSIARFGTGPTGFHASIRTIDGEIYVDQVSKIGGQHYVSYYVHDHNEPMEGAILQCGTDHGDEDQQIRQPVGVANRSAKVELHTYKIAIACTGVWGRNRGTKEKALEDMVTSVNRLNQIYENEAAFTLVIIDENDRLIHLDPATDGYTNQNEGRSLIGQNTARINSLLGGSALYDIGHIYTNSCTDVGGVAALGSMCQGNKGAGVTCHYTNLIYITVQVAAHEIGHQLSAQHTFNNCSDASGNNGNASLGNDFEPGSGSTIMSYGGLCGQNNVQGNNDDYYNNGSLVQIYNHLRRDGGGAYECADRTVTDNDPPVVNIPIEDGFYIPKSTYFVLTGEATDANGDNMTYSWEQHDAGNNTCDYGSPTGSCPLFRSLRATDVPYRFFPREGRIFSGSSDASEILPSYKRDLEFAFTVRDNNPEAGIAVWDYVEFKVDDTAGPFRVNSPGIGDEFEVGTLAPVTWDVANTDNGLVNCKTVDIYVSIDKALHRSDPKMILLAREVPNNGYAEVVIPPLESSSQARIVVYASNNIFFDLANTNFKILDATSPRPYFGLSKLRDNLCLPGSVTIDISTEALGGYDGNITFEAFDMPDEVNATFSKNNFKAGEDATVTFDVDGTLPTGSYDWAIRSISDTGDTITRKFFVDVISTDFSDLVNLSPEEGKKNDPGLPKFEWSSSFNAVEYQFQLSKDPAFEMSNHVYNEIVSDTFFQTPDFLDKKSVYYWRVAAINSCGVGSFTFPRSIGTANLDCKEYTATDTPVNISSSGTREVMSKVLVTDEGVISDINVSNVTLDHTFLKDLTAELKSPEGTTITVWTNACAKPYSMNVAFDDDSPRFFDCSNGVSIFRPQGKLADFVGQNPKGQWELTIKDTKGGDGGKLDNLSLEICGAIESNPPVLVRNELLKIQPNNNPRIGADVLKTEDIDNSPDQLIYTLVGNVEHGELTKYGTPMKVGDKFTQKEIDEAYVFYKNTEDAASDGFYFVVEDGNGGWINITRFNIEIDPSFPSSVEDEILESSISIFPNPAGNYVNITLESPAKNYNKLSVVDIHGRSLIQTHLFEGNQRINTSSLPSGMYIIMLSNGDKFVSKRLVIKK